MPFIQPGELKRHEIFPGVISGLTTGEHGMLSFVEMQQGTELPEHAHPEEQAGYMLAGKLRLRIGAQERIMQPGDDGSGHCSVRRHIPCDGSSTGGHVSAYLSHRVRGQAGTEVRTDTGCIIQATGSNKRDA